MKDSIYPIVLLFWVLERQQKNGQNFEGVTT